MANLHSRSNSFPQQAHPEIELIEDHLCRLKASQVTSRINICMLQQLASLRDLQEHINAMIQMPSMQQALSHEQSENWINQLPERSLKLVDLCGSAKDIVYLIEKFVQQLESSIRSNIAETATSNAYVASRKKITKMAKKCIKNLKSFNQNSSTLPDNEKDLMAMGNCLIRIEICNLFV